jgi:hypothetical protein
MRSVRHPIWIALRRPLLQLFVIGCVVSLVVSGRLTVRLIAGGMLGWSVIPLLEIAGFAVVRARTGRHAAFAADLDRFYAGSRTMLLWLVVLGGVVSFLTPLQTDAWSNNNIVVLAVLATTVAVVAWTARQDAQFFRETQTHRGTTVWRQVVFMRVAVWIVGLVYVAGFAAWPLVADWLHV